MTSQFSDMTSPSKLFDVVLYLLSSLFTGPSFMSLSSLVLELWQLPFVRDWPEIWKLEIPSCEFSTIPGNWGKLGRPKIRDKITPSRLGLINWWKVFVKWACRFSCELFNFFSIKNLGKNYFQTNISFWGTVGLLCFTVLTFMSASQWGLGTVGRFIYCFPLA